MNSDVIIIGAGPAGISAGIYAVSRGKKTLVLERAQVGGIIGKVSTVTHYAAIQTHETGASFAARLKEQENVKFTEKATRELEDLSAKVESQLQTAFEIFRTQRDTPEILEKVEQVEEEIDQTTEALRNHHVDRLKNKKCSARNGMLYLDMLTNLERIGDHAENIATSVDKEAPSATR